MEKSFFGTQFCSFVLAHQHPIYFMLNPPVPFHKIYWVCISAREWFSGGFPAVIKHKTRWHFLHCSNKRRLELVGIEKVPVPVGSHPSARSQFEAIVQGIVVAVEAIVKGIHNTTHAGGNLIYFMPNLFHGTCVFLTFGGSGLAGLPVSFKIC